jgi:predicted MFS family arabinose efflux permease
LSTGANVNSDPSVDMSPRASVFANRAFTIILIASSLANVGIAMFDTSMSWLMASLNPDPMMVSAVQVATMLPMFLLTLPAGALADIVDARRLLIGAQAFVATVSVAFALAVSFHLATPMLLLATTFVLGAGGALAAPAWLLTTPMLVPKEDLDSAISINNTSYNVSRAIGPALGGLLIAAISLDLPFCCYVAGNFVVLAALLWWRAPRRIQESLPTERLASALMTGLRYARYNRDIDATLMRAVAFFLFASAYWALLPLIAKKQLGNGPETYGVLLGMIGVGSIVGSFLLGWLKERLGPDRLAALATVVTIAALLMFASAREPILAGAASLLAGAAWIVMLTTLFVSAQVALPEWVRGRGLAIYLTVYFGAMTAGSAIWGKIASMESIHAALYIAAGGAFLGLVATWGRKLQTAAGLDLSPSMHWRRPVFVQPIDDDQGPILATVEYRIDPADRDKFLPALREIGYERKRDGAYAWMPFEDVRVPGRIVETFLIQSLLELKHLRARVTEADRLQEQCAHQYLLEPLKISILVAPKRHREKRRKAPAFTPQPAPAE